MLFTYQNFKFLDNRGCLERKFVGYYLNMNNLIANEDCFLGIDWTKEDKYTGWLPGFETTSSQENIYSQRNCDENFNENKNQK